MGSPLAGISCLPTTVLVSMAMSFAAGCTDTFDVSLGDDPARVELVASADRICRGQCFEMSASVRGAGASAELVWSPTVLQGAGPHRVCPEESDEYVVTVVESRDGGTVLATAGHDVIVEDCDDPLLLDASVCDSTECPLCISNPSFEGTPGYASVPQPYVVCEGPPDTRPVNGSSGDIGPTEGTTYLGMDSGPNMEAASQELCAPLEAGREHPLAIDLAVREDSGRLEPARFEIWGGNAECDRAELLWSQALSETDIEWRTYGATLVPDASYTHLTLQASGQSQGYVIVDDIAACACPPGEILAVEIE